MGLSLAGAVVSLAILAPNVLLLFFRPVDSPPPTRSPWPLAWLERAGQALCLVVPALTGHRPGNPWWLTATIICMVAYLGLWVRYLVTGRRFAALYERLGPVPVPMAVFPVAAFLFSAGWLGSWWVALSAVILAVGHIPLALGIARATRQLPPTP
jgi:hypothetical protein